MHNNTMYTLYGFTCTECWVVSLYYSIRHHCVTSLTAEKIMDVEVKSSDENKCEVRSPIIA